MKTLLTIIIAAAAVWASAQSVPPLINYQGRLTDQTGAAMPPGAYILQFRVWNDPLSTNSANLVWGQQQNVTIQSNGIFSVILGSTNGTPIPGTTVSVSNLTDAFNGTNCFLGLTVSAGPSGVISKPAEIVPRQQLLSVPFAVQAQQAQQAQNAQQAQVASSLVPSYAITLVPPGSVVAYMGTAAPSGWLVCDGSAVSRTTFPSLFNAVGTSSGVGDGSTTFNLPDMRGVFLRGVDGGSGRDPDSTLRVAANPGGNSGPTVGSFQSDDFKSHTHTQIGGPTTQNLSNGSDIAIPHNTVSPTGATGGNETRPKNLYVTYT